MVLPATALFAAVLPVLVQGDLPVHCLHHQVAGEWEFTLGPLADKRSSCGHHRPDSQYGQPAAVDFLARQGITTKRRFTLQDMNVVSSKDGSGTWTMIYDEAFEVVVGDFTYLAFSKFEYVDDGAHGKQNISHCDQTELGWYHNRARDRWGCYFGKKVGSDGDDNEDDMQLAERPDVQPSANFLGMPSDSSDEQSQTVEDDSSADANGQDPSADDADSAPSTTPVVLQQESEQFTTSALPQLDLADFTDTPPQYKPWIPGSAGYDKPMLTEWQDSVASALNLLQLGWVATRYNKFEGKTPRELNRFAGVRRSRPTPEKKPQPASFSSFLGMRSRVSQTYLTDSSEKFSWQNKDGVNWLSPVVNQGDCGSCYTISTVHMLTARNKIRVNSLHAPAFSVSFPLYCSEYNQGCDGGYGFLQSKWSEDVGLVPESCAPFSDGGGACQLMPNCNLGAKRYRAVNHHYVGGYYGAGQEDKIRKELVESGPLVLSFEPKEDFMYYKQGVYRSGPNRLHQEWEQVDHAVLLVGYGEEQDLQYWILQNSWGDDWGEDGYFRMARGMDESGIESIAVAADIIEDNSNVVLEDFIASLQA